MSIRLQVFLLAGILFFAGLILFFLKKKHLSLKYTLLWIIAVVIMLITALLPEVVVFISSIVGVQTPSNLIFALEGFFVLLLLLSLTVIASRSNIKIYKLAQMQALLEQRVRMLEKIILESAQYKQKTLSSIQESQEKTNNKIPTTEGD